MVATKAMFRNAAAAPSSPTSEEEFVGPLNTWTQLAATGVAATDTAALQAAFNALGSSAPVLYLTGDFVINATITLEAALHIMVIGADPATTSITWAGAANGHMILWDGVAYSKFSRITLDGDSIADVGMDQNYDGVGNYFDTGNEYSDCVFQNFVEVGIDGGASDFGFAETEVIRCTFRDSYRGIRTNNFNALDLFIWYCLFEDLSYGVTNHGGGGGFNIYHSVFKRSLIADIQIAYAEAFSFRNNYSIDSQLFFQGSLGTNTSATTLQGNTILDPVATECIVFGYLGPAFMFDNTIRSLVGVTTQRVVNMGDAGADLLTIGNTFTTSGPFTGNSCRSHSIDDVTVTRASITTAEPTLPSTPANQSRTIYNIAPGTSTASIQSTINTAAGGTRSVVHFEVGTHTLTTTLTIPASADIQLIGDGPETILNWGAGDAGPMLSFASPARAIIRDLRVTGAATANGIVVDDCDQDGARVFMDQPYLSNHSKNLVVNGLDYTNVQLRSFYHSGASGTCNPSVQVIGGGANGGMTNIFGGASSNAVVCYSTSGTAHVHIKDIWYETSSFGSLFMNITGSGVFTYSDFRIHPSATTPGPAIDINAFTGIAACMGSKIDGDITLSGSSSGGKVLVAGMNTIEDAFYTDTTSPALTALCIHNQGRENPTIGYETSQLAEVGSYDSTFVKACLAEERALDFVEIGAIAAGKTDLRIYRVRVDLCLVGIQLN